VASRSPYSSFFLLSTRVFVRFQVKSEALKRLIVLMLNGDKFPSLLMIIIRYVMPSQDHTIKKLLLIFWEIVPKHTADGKLLQEMILVCDAYR
jgi:coatomer subunit beta